MINSNITKEGTVDEFAKYMTSLVVKTALFDIKKEIFEYSFLLNVENPKDVDILINSGLIPESVLYLLFNFLAA
jgi:hypothetical protein